MAKRFTDNEKWKKQFFKSLSTVNKLFFLYILDECDHAGIWHVEPDIVELRIGAKIDVNGAKKELGRHIHEFDDGEKWFIPSFIEFQYGNLNPSVNAHKSVIGILTKRKLLKVYEQFINCSLRVMDMDKDMDKDKDNKPVKYYYDLIPDKLQTAQFQDIWTEWVKYRNEIKKKLTETAAKQQLKFLAAQINPIDIIEESIKNQWQGLFVKEPTAKGNGYIAETTPVPDYVNKLKGVNNGTK